MDLNCLVCMVGLLSILVASYCFDGLFALRLCCLSVYVVWFAVLG